MKNEKIYANATNETTEKKQPLKRFKSGPIQATVWENENKEGKTFNTVSINRSYMDKLTGEWKKTSTLRTNDLPRATLVLNKAFEFMTIQPESQEAIA